MNAIVMMVLGLGAMFLGYVFYSKFIAEKIFKLDPDFRTPAHELEDGVDFVPTNKYVLWGHHFTSVAGAAPIIGPAIAVIWGWVPAFLFSVPYFLLAYTMLALSGQVTVIKPNLSVT
jgi:carbon starvation protein